MQQIIATNLESKLAAIAGRATRYEVALTQHGQPVALVGYTARKSRPGLLKAAQVVGQAIIDRTAMPQDATMSWSHGTMVLGFDGWAVKFTGRTQRDAIMTGELVPVGGAR